MRAFAVLLTVVLCGFAPTWAQAPNQSLEDLNNEFRQIYAADRQAVRNADAAVILALAGKLVFLHNGAREEHQLLDTRWQELKMIDHVPLMIFLLLLPHVDQPLPQQAVLTLQQLRLQILAAAEKLALPGLSAAAVERGKNMLHSSADFAAQVLHEGTVSKKQLDAFVASTAIADLKNADDAETIELSEADRCVQAWRKGLTAAEWSAVRVVVCDSHMPRREEHLMQYFLALFNEHAEGDRVVYLENSEDEDKALDLLATHQLDRQIAVSFFHDPERMHRDLLSDGARHYLELHPPQR